MGRISDFRIASRDQTANFSIEQDNQLANALSKVYSCITTFNELNEVYQALKTLQKAGAEIDDIDMSRFMLELGSRPRKMSSDQCVHGAAVLEKIESFLGESGKNMPKAGIALENGCGLGLFIDGLSARFNQLYVLDLSLCYLLLASKIIDERGIENARLICGSVESLPVQSGVIDFVHSNNVIEHVGDQLAMLNEAHRVLNVNGVLYVQSPNRCSLWIEPHFALPGYGFIPKSIRRLFIEKKQKRSIDDISLLTLGEFRTLLNKQPWQTCKISFVPRRMKRTVNAGLVRSAVVGMLDSRVFGNLFDRIINKTMLVVMPYHVAICTKSDIVTE